MDKKLIRILCLLLVTTLLVTGIGGYLKYGILSELGLFQEESLIAVPFMLMADEAAKFALKNHMQKQNETQPAETDPIPTEPPVEETVSHPETQPPTEIPTEPATEPPTEPVVIEIDESWFDDALFIGDSRVADMRDMARLGDADYFCATSMTVFQIMQAHCSDLDFYSKNLDYVLSNNTYGKIYIHLGLNEVGYGPDLIVAKFRELVNMIREKQPDAAIIIQSVMTVRDYFAKGTFALENIYGLNERLKQFAEEEGLFYEETNDFAADEAGFMRPEISYDGAHPIGTGYQEWAAWIMENAKNWGIP